MQIGVLMTCHNRKANTLSGLRALFEATLPPGVALRVFLVDDGSSDGTAEAVAAEFPQVSLQRGSGQLYWCGGMRLAFEHASGEDLDFHLWLNDDTVVAQYSLEALVATYRKHQASEAIVVGATCDAATGMHTYGGLARRVLWRPLSFTLVPPSDEAVHCDTMNGNIVLVPRAAFERLGNLDPAFVHGIGDLDYGLRARQAGIPILIAPGFLGTCSRNPVRGSFSDHELSAQRRWQLLTSPKGLPLRSWLAFSRRHAGLFWPVYSLWPYLKVLVP